MPAEIGLNFPADKRLAAQFGALLGARWIRVVLKPEYDLTPWIQDAHHRGLKVLGVIARESLGIAEPAERWPVEQWIESLRNATPTPNAQHPEIPSEYMDSAEMYGKRYRNLLDALQVGNESDHESPSSWTMAADDLNNLLLAFNAEFAHIPIVGPGMVSGDPHYLDAVDLDLVDAIAVHPYGRWPNNGDWSELPGGFGSIAELLDQYRYHNRPIWITELGVSTHQVNEEFQARYVEECLKSLKLRTDVPVVTWFCADDEMVERFGLYKNNLPKPAAPAFMSVAGRVQEPDPMPTFLKQGFYIQQWQYGGGTAAEKDIHELIATALEYKAAGVMEKVADGTAWMGTIRNTAGVLVSPNSPKNRQDCWLHMDACKQAGLIYLPWTNPLHGSREFLAQQAAMYGGVGYDCGFLVWDSEPYDQFWGANRPAGDAFYMLEEFRRFAPDCVNIWQPDPRPGRLAELRPDEWSQHMNVYAPQSYWGDFGTNPTAEITRAHGQAAMFGIECAPTISTGHAPADEFAIAITAMGNLGITSLCTWRLGTLTADHLAVLRDLAGTGTSGGDPEPDPCEHLHQQLRAWRDRKPYKAVTKKQLTALLA